MRGLSPQSVPGEPAAPQGRTAPQWIKTGLRVLISFGLLAYLVAQVDVGQSLRVLAQARPTLLVVLLAMFFFERLFAAFRWYVLVRDRCPGITFTATARIVFVSNFAGAFLPGMVGMEAIRIYGLKKSACNLAEAFTSVFVDRLLGIFSLILFVFLGLALTARLLPGAIAWAALACMALFVVMLFMLYSTRIRGLLDRLTPEFLSRRIGGRLNRLYESLDAYRRDRGLMAWGLALALVMQGIRVVGTVVAARTLRLDDVPMIDFVVFVPIIMFVVMVPISIGGLGVRETAFAKLFGLAGMTAEGAVALSILIFLTELVTALPGAWLCVRGLAPPNLVARPGVGRSP